MSYIRLPCVLFLCRPLSIRSIRRHKVLGKSDKNVYKIRISISSLTVRQASRREHKRNHYLKKKLKLRKYFVKCHNGWQFSLKRFMTYIYSTNKKFHSLPVFLLPTFYFFYLNNQSQPRKEIFFSYSNSFPFFLFFFCVVCPSAWTCTSFYLPFPVGVLPAKFPVLLDVSGLLPRKGETCIYVLMVTRSVVVE